jgi:hypothetical protein
MRISQRRLMADEDLLSNLLHKAADLNLQIYELNKLRYRFRQAEQLASQSRPVTARHRQAPSGASTAFST